MSVDRELVCIEWLDAQTSEDRWTPIADVRTDLRRIRSVGWLVAQTADSYAIAQDIDESDDGGPWANTVGVIPFGCVVSVSRLTVQAPRLEIA